MLVFILGALLGSSLTWLWQYLKRDSTNYSLKILWMSQDNTSLKTCLNRKKLPWREIIDDDEHTKTIIGHFGDYRINELFNQSIHFTSIARLREASICQD